MLENKETIKRGVNGTIIDIETIGEFIRQYPSYDLMCYSELRPTIFGYLTEDNLVQYCAEGSNDISELIKIIRDTMPQLPKPYYALNCYFERGILFHRCDLEPEFIDVRGETRGRKWAIRESLGIPSYNDPFNGVGYTCLLEWKKENYGQCLAHNRACLLIERDILEKVGDRN